MNLKRYILSLLLCLLWAYSYPQSVRRISDDHWQCDYNGQSYDVFCKNDGQKYLEIRNADVVFGEIKEKATVKMTSITNYEFMDIDLQNKKGKNYNAILNECKFMRIFYILNETDNIRLVSVYYNKSSYMREDGDDLFINAYIPVECLLYLRQPMCRPMCSYRNGNYNVWDYGEYQWEWFKIH